MAEIMSVLFFHTMRYKVSVPKDPSNDRFILSKGHAAPILYAGRLFYFIKYSYFYKIHIVFVLFHQFMYVSVKLIEFMYLISKKNFSLG